MECKQKNEDHEKSVKAQPCSLSSCSKGLPSYAALKIAGGTLSIKSIGGTVVLKNALSSPKTVSSTLSSCAALRNIRGTLTSSSTLKSGGSTLSSATVKNVGSTLSSPAMWKSAGGIQSSPVVFTSALSSSVAGGTLSSSILSKTTGGTLSSSISSNSAGGTLSSSISSSSAGGTLSSSVLSKSTLSSSNSAGGTLSSSISSSSAGGTLSSSVLSKSTLSSSNSAGGSLSSSISSSSAGGTLSSLVSSKSASGTMSTSAALTITLSSCTALRSVRSCVTLKRKLDVDSSDCTPEVEAKSVNSGSQRSNEIDFATRRSLLRYKCEVCGRECPSKHKLKRHLSTHSDARPFPCKLCGRSFKWSEYLQKHMRLQHPSGKKCTAGEMPSCPSPSAECNGLIAQLRSQPASSEDAEPILPLSVPQEASEEAGACTTTSETDHSEDDDDSPLQETKDAVDREKEQIGVLPQKQNVCIGVDMDAEDEIQKTTDEIYEVVESFSMHESVGPTYANGGELHMNDDMYGETNAMHVYGGTTDVYEYGGDSGASGDVHAYGGDCGPSGDGYKYGDDSGASGDVYEYGGDSGASGDVHAYRGDSVVSGDVHTYGGSSGASGDVYEYGHDSGASGDVYAYGGDSGASGDVQVYGGDGGTSGDVHSYGDDGMSVDLYAYGGDGGRLHSAGEVYSMPYQSGITNCHPPPLLEASQTGYTHPQAKPDGSSFTQCSIMATNCNFADSILDSNLISQYSGEGHGSSANPCSNTSTSSMPSNDLISQSADGDPNLNYPSPNQFYNSRGQLEEKYNDVSNINYSSLPAGISSPNTETHICNGNDSAYMSVRYDFCSVSNQDQHSNVIYDEASACEPSTNRESSAECYPTHNCNVPSDYQSTQSGCSNLCVPVAMPSLLPNSCVASQQVESSDLDGDTIKSSDGHVERSKVEVGIQCEVGSETLQALFDEEEEGDESSRGDDSIQELDRHSDTQKSPAGTKVLGSHSVGDVTDERLVQKFPCKVEGCEKAYIHRKDVIRHMRIRHGITPQKVEAIVVETPEKPHVCGIASCKRSYFHMKDLRRHQRLCHKVNLVPATVTLEEVQGPEPCDPRTQLRYPCDFNGCLRSYVHKKDLVRHKRLFHKDASSKPSIPTPIKFTDMELKQIRQKVKLEIDTKEQKMRLDSAGSNVSTSSNSLEDCSIDIGGDTTDCTILLSSSSSLQEIKSTSDLDHTTISGDVASILGALEQHSAHLFTSNH